MLIGWAFDIHRLQSVGPGLATMKPLAAVCLVLLGAALIARDVRQPVVSVAALVSALMAAALGIATIAESLFSLSFGIETVLFEAQVRAEGTGTVAPGRMAMVAAVGVAIAGGSLALRQLGQSRLAHVGGLVVGLLAGVAVLGYAYGLSSVKRSGASTNIAVHTAISLVVVGIGIVASTPQHGLTALKRRGSAAGVIVRRALPALIGAPLVLGWLSLEGQRAGWYSPELAIASMAIGAALIGGLVLWWATSSVAELDAERGEAMDQLARTNERLEEEVASRTASLASQGVIQQASLEALEEGVALSTLAGEVLLINRAGRDLVGYSPDELTEMFRAGRWQTNREDGSVMPPEERPIRRTMDTGEPVTGQVLMWRHKSGRFVILRVTTRPVFEAGELTGVVTAFADVTVERATARAAEQHLAALAQLNDELAQAVSIKDWFLSTATHDMRSPITSIIGFASVILRSGDGLAEEKCTEMIEAIHRQGIRLSTLVQDLQSIVIIDGGVVQMEPTAVSLDKSLRQIVADMDVEVDVRVQAGAVAFVDPMRFAQMVTNLIQNARTYGRPPVAVRASIDGAWATVRVTDAGDGVDPEFVPRLFDRFATTGRGADSTSQGSSGTGLGLAIVRGLAEAQGGGISYEPALPCGACFVLRLPTDSMP